MVKRGKAIVDSKCVLIAVCDDDKLFAVALKNKIETYMHDRNLLFQLIMLTNPVSLIEKCSNFDIIFMDMEMPQMQGLKAAEILHGKNRKCKIIFITHYKEYMQQAFAVKAFRYLCKPCEEEEIFAALRDALEEFTDDRGILIETRESADWIFIKDIIYVESLGDDLLIRVMDKEVITAKTLNFLINELGNNFYQCHKSYAVNLKYVNYMDDRNVYLCDKFSIPVSTRKRSDFKKAFYSYVKKNSYPV